jgi:secreted Zn-dependent insulinase-like peptidase
VKVFAVIRCWACRRRSVFLFVLVALTSACQHPAPSAAKPVNAIVASDSDHRSFRYLTLPNQLRVLLISAPNTDKAAAALDVNIGSRQDPAERQGLAHFLEHMLFLGTDKYSNAEEYQDFISAHSGSHNAFTAFEHTNYFFDIDSAYLEPALDRFARFFVAPLFTAEYVDREKHAVDSEYQANIQDDQHRELDVMREIVNPAHPFSKFSVGSLATLADRPEHPVRDDLLAFYQRNYSANLMTLVVVGREPLDKLQQMVATRFAAVPNRDNKIEPIAAPLYAAQQLPLFVQIKPLQQQRTLALAWPLPDQHDDYRGKSLEYIGNILGHEGDGSLLSALKQRGWAQALSAGQGIDYQGGAQFNIGIELTPRGSQHVDDIVQLAYQAVQRIRDGGIENWLYREQQIVAAQRFRFREIPEPIGEVSQLAGNLQNYPAAEVMRGDYLMELFEPERIAALLQQLTPVRMVLTYSAPEASTDKASQYYATPYSVRAIAPERLQRWQTLAANSAIKLPAPNIFVADNLVVKPLQGTATKPVSLSAENGLHLWFFQDPIFRLPKAAVTIDVRSPIVVDSAANAVKSELLVRILRENLNEFSYPASLSGLGYEVSHTGRGIMLRTNGFDQKQAVLLEHMLAALQHPQFSADIFARVQHEYKRELEDNSKRPPYELLLADLPTTLIRERWADSDLLPHVDKIDIAQMQKFTQALLANIDIDMLVYGNVVEADARQYGALVARHLLTSTQPASIPPVQILQAPPHDIRRTLVAPHNDAGLLWYRQAADNAKPTRAALGVSAQIIGTDFYAKLRTEQQLGYIVMATAYPIRDVPGLVFLAQSPVAGPSVLADAYRKFLQQWSQRSEIELRPLFERHRAALAQRLAQEPKNLGEANDRLWQDLSSGYLQFDSREQVLAAVNALTFEQWLALFRRDVLGADGRTIWLSNNGRFTKSALQTGVAIDDLNRFKNSQQFYQFE